MFLFLPLRPESCGFVVDTSANFREGLDFIRASEGHGVIVWAPSRQLLDTTTEVNKGAYWYETRQRARKLTEFYVGHPNVIGSDPACLSGWKNSFGSSSLGTDYQNNINCLDQMLLSSKLACAYSTGRRVA